MIIAGLTGSIAVGKSTVAKLFQSHNIPVIDADELSRHAVKPHSLGLVEIIDAFGLRMIQSDGYLNRPRLAQLVFSDAAAMQILTSILLPHIHEEATKRFQELQNSGHSVAVYDAAMIIENQQVHKYQPLVVVHCTPEQQLERLLKRGLTREEAMRRMKAQIPSHHKLQLADFAVDTNNTVAETVSQVELIIQHLKRISQ